MFHVNLSRINIINGKYCVYLDGENRYFFSDKRKAQDFLRQLSERFTEALVFVNDEYCQVNEIYRQYFFILDDFKMRYEIEN